MRRRRIAFTSMLLISAAGAAFAEERAGQSAEEPKLLPAGPGAKFRKLDADTARLESFPQLLQLAPHQGSATWRAAGPAPILYGQTEGMGEFNSPVVGAVSSILPHPTDPDWLMIGAVNGGVWRTTNARSSAPQWTALTDTMPSLSISDLVMDPENPQRIAASVGLYSSFGRRGGLRTGIIATNDGGDTWQPKGREALAGKNISGVALHQGEIVVSVNTADSNTFPNIGIWRSTDDGETWSQVTNGIPAGACLSLAQDPNVPSRLFTPLVFAQFGESQNGIYRSNDFGAFWERVSSPDINSLMFTGSQTSNAELSVGKSGTIFAGIINNGGLAGLFRAEAATAGPAAWTPMDLPTTNESGGVFGLQPRPKPGGQGSIHFSIAADPSNPNLVYLGGDRQPLFSEAGFPNSIGAEDYSGRLFRVDASLAPGSQSIPLTHLPTTTRNSSPHADSRDMAFDANGELIEGDDGGIFRRTNPRGRGDWEPVIGAISVSEFHSADFDRVTQAVVAGSQDNGTSVKVSPNSTAWELLLGGDGGVVAVDDKSYAGTFESEYYVSAQFFGNFLRAKFNSGFALTGLYFPELTIDGSGPLDAVDPTIQFYQPFVLNSANPAKGAIGTQYLYLSGNRFDNLVRTYDAGSGDRVVSMVYGGYREGAPNENVLWFATFSEVYFRPSTQTELGMIEPAGLPNNFSFNDIAAGHDDYRQAIATTSREAFMSLDLGDTWSDVRGDLPADAVMRSALIITGPDFAYALVGTNIGIYKMRTDQPGLWTKFGEEIPNAPVWDLRYDERRDVIVAATIGRGAWLCDKASEKLFGFSIVPIPPPLGSDSRVSALDRILGYRPTGSDRNTDDTIDAADVVE